MNSLQIFAGFGPKDLMVLLYIPAFLVLIVGSLIMLIIKRGGRPYMLPMILGVYGPFILIPIIWYLYDKFGIKKTDTSQSVLLATAGIVIGILMIATTPLVPETDDAVNAMAALAFIVSLLSIVVAIRWRKK